MPYKINSIYTRLSDDRSCRIKITAYGPHQTEKVATYDLNPENPNTKKLREAFRSGSGKGFEELLKEITEDPAVGEFLSGHTGVFVTPSCGDVSLEVFGLDTDWRTLLTGQEAWVLQPEDEEPTE